MGAHVKIVDRDTGWTEFFKKVEAARGERYAKVGVLADTEAGGMHEADGDLTVAEIFAVNEFGTEDGHVPERRPLRATFDETREELAEKAGKFVIEVLFGSLKVDQALNAIGAMLANAVKRRITDGEGLPPPNAPATIKAKGSARPLVDTARMLGAITWAIVTGRPKD
jgi:hypothetical protein